MTSKSEYFKNKLFSYQAIISITLTVLMAIAGSIAELNAIANIAFSFVVFVLTFITTELYEYTTFLAKHRSNVLTMDKFFDAGFETYFPEFTEVNFREELRHSNSVKIISVYSQKIFTNNYSAFSDFLKSPTTKLEVVLLKPDPNLDAYSFLKRKYSHDDNDTLKNAIISFKNELSNLKLELSQKNSEPHGEIELFYSEIVPQYSLVLFDNVAYITLYKNARGRTTKVPAFMVRNRTNASMFDFIKNDYDELISDTAFVSKQTI